MNLFEAYCNGSRPRTFKPATLCMDADELTKYVSRDLKADDAELLCAQFDIDVPDNKQSTASRFLAEGLYLHATFVRGRVARQARLKDPSAPAGRFRSRRPRASQSWCLPHQEEDRRGRVRRDRCHIAGTPACRAALQGPQGLQGQQGCVKQLQCNNF